MSVRLQIKNYLAAQAALLVDGHPLKGLQVNFDRGFRQASGLGVTLENQQFEVGHDAHGNAIEQDGRQGFICYGMVMEGDKLNREAAYELAYEVNMWLRGLHKGDESFGGAVCRSTCSPTIREDDAVDSHPGILLKFILFYDQ
jgi:hypothetical protein